MTILLCEPRGFCAGVDRAIQIVEEALRLYGAPIYVLHEIVHNKHVIDDLGAKGTVFVKSLGEVPEGAITVFSAHGVSDAVVAEADTRRLRVIDATCPLVTKVHMEAIKYAKAEYNIILIGHEGHDEVIGTMGEAPESITLVETPEDVAQLPFSQQDKLAYLTQTTLSVEEAGIVISRLKERFPRIESPPKEDICYATTNRQHAVRELISQADALIVLGSQNSSNSRRLMEIGLSEGKPAHLVDGAADLRPEWFDGVERVLVTAGASAPEVVVEECLAYLRERFGAEVREVTTREEHVTFPLPKELRTLQPLPQSTTPGSA
ncbi:MAG: 4-hydroxy-3-methylbut-2-enyl diphosphate reductase [Planctomycetaceae bacterium]|nr:4-hydroxy-3-methylbut-2-enyl diphosphate reductase [Planctomycetaceae bacterium]